MYFFSTHIYNAVSRDNIDANTKLVVATGGTFNASVYYVFNKNETKEEKFHGCGTVNMMRQTRDLRYGKLPFFDATAVDIPASSDKKMSILVILPNAKDGIKKLDNLIRNFQLLPTLKNKLKMSSVDLSIPFAFYDDRRHLNGTLQKMHKTNLFGSDADLSGIAGEPKELKVDKLFAGLRFTFGEGQFDYYQSDDEELNKKFDAEGHDRYYGGKTGAGPKVRFNADHPFIFILHTEEIVLAIAKFACYGFVSKEIIV